MRVFDIGFHNGDDSAYYLERGHDVVAVEANPALAESGRGRFAGAVASGRLTILNVAMWRASGEHISFYVNDTDSGWSSIDPAQGQRGGKFHQVEIETVSVSDLFDRYGVPWYLKIDIEGADEMVLRSLPRKTEMPRYLSCELGHGSPAVDLLSSVGYSGFKLINPETLTQSLPVFNDELFIRALRKASVLCPPVRSAIAGLPDAFRPAKILWDAPRDRFGYSFSAYTTGPFGEETDGAWISAANMKKRLHDLFDRYLRDGMVANFWYDLHARHRTADQGQR